MRCTRSRYAITRDQEYAHTAAQLLDGLPTACPHSIGRDLQRNIPAVFYRRGYTAGRILQDFVDAADRIWNSGELDVDSPTNDGTIKQNVTENLIVVIAPAPHYASLVPRVNPCRGYTPDHGRERQGPR